jgi:hypothetical protein
VRHPDLLAAFAHEQQFVARPRVAVALEVDLLRHAVGGARASRRAGSAEEELQLEPERDEERDPEGHDAQRRAEQPGHDEHHERDAERHDAAAGTPVSRCGLHGSTVAPAGGANGLPGRPVDTTRGMAIGTQTALRGVAGRVAGRKASRIEALAAATGAALVTYRVLRSSRDAQAPRDAG